MAMQMAEGTWEDAEALVGGVLAELVGADPVNDVMVRHQLEALEWDEPLFRDDEAARAAGLGGRIAPFSMYMTFGMPAYWRAGDQPLRPDLVAPFAFGRVPAPGSAMMATGTSVDFGVPMRPGDRLSSVWRLTGVTRKSLKVGDGAFLEFEVTYRNQDADIVALERTSVFRYEPAVAA